MQWNECVQICPNPVCPRRDLRKSNSKGYFLELCLKSQLETIMSRIDIQKALKKQKKKISNKVDGVWDITSGSLYQKFMGEGGPFSSVHPYNMSFSLNTDGVNLVKSQTWSIWPVYLMINKLPYSMRIQKQNMIIAGVWFSLVKPVMNLFLGPIRKALASIEKDGISISIDGEMHTCRGFLICATCDIPAKALVLGMKQHNGEYSCTRCQQSGRNYRTDTKGNVRVFPYQTEDPTGPSRTHENYQADAISATTTGVPTRGIKGPSPLLGLQCFDIIRGTTVDYMHCILQGVTKLMCSLWFAGKNSKELFSLNKLTPTVDKRLKNINPVQSITRKPRI